MSWTTPKTDWGVDLVGSDDMNRIELNTETLHKGNGSSSAPTVNPNVSKQLQINSINEVFVVDDTSYHIALILTESRQSGNKIYILGDGCQPYFETGGTPSGDYKAIKIYSAASYYEAAVDAITMLVYYNSLWYLAPLIA